MQNDREVVKELQEEGTGTVHYELQWWCYQGLPYCHFGTFRCFACMAQEDGESNLSDSDADGLGKMHIQTPLQATDRLADYLHAENEAGSSDAMLWYSSSVGAVCPTGHKSDSSRARFDSGAHYLGDVELAEPMEEDGSVAVVPSLSLSGMEIYEVDDPYPIDDEDLFSSPELGGNLLCLFSANVGGCWRSLVCGGVQDFLYRRRLWCRRRPWVQRLWRRRAAPTTCHHVPPQCW